MLVFAKVTIEKCPEITSLIFFKKIVIMNCTCLHLRPERIETRRKINLQQIKVFHFRLGAERENPCKANSLGLVALSFDF